MMEAESDPELPRAVDRPSLIDQAIRLSLVGLLVLWSAYLLSPFVVVLVWAMVITVALYPVHDWLSAKLGGRQTLSAALITVAWLAVILGPVAVMVINAAESAEAIISGIRSGTLSAPLPPESVKSIPLVGGKVYDAWYLAATNLVGVLQAHSGTVLHAGGWLAGSFAGAGVTLLLFIISIIVSGFLYRPGPAIAAFARRLGGRVAGQRGVEFIAMAGATIRNVSRGVMGVAIGQSILLGIGMMAAGVPAAGLLTLVILILCIVQVGPALVVIGVLVWAWTSLGTAAAILLTIYLVVVTLGDNLVKPALMSKGLSTPTLVIFAGVLGGTIAHGLIGLFLGPIVLAVSYDLLMAWLDPSSAAEAGAQAERGIGRVDLPDA